MGRGKTRRALLIAAAFVALVAATDRNISARAAIAAIDVYRANVSPRLRGVVSCRFTPTCSAYGRESIRKHGFVVGGAKTVARIARCGPWTPAGTVDQP